MLSKYEQETVLLYNEAEPEATVHTYDRKLIAKLERLALKYPEKVRLSSVNSFGGVEYVVPKSCVIVREPFSDERRKAASELAKSRGYAPPRR